MTSKNQYKLTLDRPAVYQIKVPGHLEKDRMDWFGEMGVETSQNEAGMPISILTGSLDQAALFGLLRRLYFLEMPLISVNCLEIG